MTSAARAQRERRRLIASAERGRRRRAHALALQARTLARIDDLDAELRDVAGELAELDAAEGEAAP